MQAYDVVGESRVGCRFTIGHDDLRRAFATMRHIVRETITCRLDAKRMTLIGKAKDFTCEADIAYVEKPSIPEDESFVLIFASDLFSRVLCGQHFGNHNLMRLSDPGSDLNFHCLSQAPESSHEDDPKQPKRQVWRVVLGALSLVH